MHIFFQKYINIKIYGIMILPVVLYSYESWCVVLNQEHRLREFDK
jgi:hypothetical protein